MFQVQPVDALVELEVTDELIRFLKVEGSKSKSHNGQIFERVIAADGGVDVDAWVGRQRESSSVYIAELATSRKQPVYRPLRLKRKKSLKWQDAARASRRCKNLCRGREFSRT